MIGKKGKFLCEYSGGKGGNEIEKISTQRMMYGT